MSPEIIQRLIPVEVVKGGMVKFQCRVVGEPAPEIEWYKDDQLLDESDRMKFENKDGVCVLTISDVTPFDEAEYKVLARNPLGTATCSAELLVEESVSKPELMQPMEDVEVKAGEDGCFCVRVKGDVKVDWYKNDKLLEDAGHVVIVDEEDGETFTLAIEEATVEDSDVYKCVASNKAGKVTCSASLKVASPKPQIIISSEELSVEAVGRKNSPHVDEELAKTEKERQTTEKVPREITPNIPQKSDSLPTSSLPETSEAPCFDEPQKDIVHDVNEGETVGFKVNVLGKPEPTVEWFKDDERLSNGESCQITKNEGEHELRLKNIALEDSGIYKCVASSENGKEERTFKLDVEGKFVTAEEILLLPITTIPVKSPYPFDLRLLSSCQF